MTRVEPSLQAAFVEYGGNRHGFLAFSEIHPDYYQIPVADRQALLRAEAEAAEAEDEEEEEERRGGRRRRRGRNRGGDRHQSRASGEEAGDDEASSEASSDDASHDAHGGDGEHAEAFHEDEAAGEADDHASDDHSSDDHAGDEASSSMAHEAGGDVLGIIPTFLVGVERALETVEHIIVDNMHERKMLMFQRSDSFVVLPGGIGTLEEVVELLSWRRLDLHAKPVVFYNPRGFWDPLFALFKHTVDERLTPPDFMEAWVSVTEADQVVPALLGQAREPFPSEAAVGRRG